MNGRYGDMSSYERERERIETITRGQSDRMGMEIVENREYIYRLSPSGSQPCTLSASLGGGRLEPQLAHSSD